MVAARLQGRKRTSKAQKRRETSEIRAFVWARAKGICEACKAAPATELDHAWGRGKEPQSIFNTWALCTSDHHDKTDSKPSKVAWLTIYLRHVTVHGYEEEVAKAKAAHQFFSLKAAFLKR